MLTLHDWRQAISETAWKTLQHACWCSPPVDALVLARALKLTVAWDWAQQERGRIKRIAGRATIFLRPEERPERTQWAAAHEIGEHLAWQVCQSLGLDGTELSPRQREGLANQLAQELLLPRAWFHRDCIALDFDLDELKTLYATASHELIAWRWLDLDMPGIVTVFDRGVQTQRRSNLPAGTPLLSAVERECWSLLQETRQPVKRADSHMTVRGWCVDSPGWQREILYARCTQEDFQEAD